jgi:hypothetical protein
VRERDECDALRRFELGIGQVVGGLASLGHASPYLRDHRQFVVLHRSTIAPILRMSRASTDRSLRPAKRPADGLERGLDPHSNMCSMGADEDDRLILAALAAAHPAMVEIGALRDLAGVQYPDESVRRLRDDGLVVRAGDLVGTSRTFRRAQSLLTS